MDLLALAKTIAERVEAEASRVKIPAAVCVIDVHGNLALHHRRSAAMARGLAASASAAAQSSRTSPCWRRDSEKPDRRLGGFVEEFGPTASAPKRNRVDIQQ
jgi:uncharacterized protein GlcG (DUF336 family)